MRWISIHKSTKDMEAGELPPARVMEGMGPLIGEMVQKGVFLGGEGLRPSSLGVRLKFANGTRTIEKGPLQGANELVAAFSIVKARSIEDAIEWATRFAPAGDAEIDVRPVTEYWDLGVMPKPAGETMTRYMIARKADRDSEAGLASATIRPAADLGELLLTERIQPSANGLRLRFKGGKRTVIDGPFTESKELIAGYSIMRSDSREELVEWATRFADLLGDLEIDIRPLYD
jgi:hypothetical protein